MGNYRVPAAGAAGIGRNGRYFIGSNRIAETASIPIAKWVSIMQSKKKCDEREPRCFDCSRLNLVCQYPSKKNPSKNNPSNKSQSERSKTDSPEVYATESPIAYPIDDSDGYQLSLSPITPENDEEFLASLFPHPYPKPCIRTHLNSSLISANPHLHCDEDRSLFNHFIHTVARALSRSNDPDTNPFLVSLLPLAETSNTVTSVLLSLSGCHWKRVYPSIWGRALKRQGQALSQVHHLLTQSDQRSVFEACATVLLLCLTELFDGTSRSWKWHLKAASAILKSPTFQSLTSSTEWVFCISLFHYLDSMSTISRCKPPLLHNGDGMTELITNYKRSSIPGLEEGKSTDAIYGLSPVLFDYLGMVNILANHRSKRVDELSELGFRAAATHVATRIDDWRLERVASEDAEVESATTAFEWAIRLRLHQVVDGYNPLDDFAEKAVTKILDETMKVGYASRLEGCLLFPLVIAGSSTVDMDRRMEVKERLMVMENTLGFNHIHHCLQLVSNVWERATCASDMNWAAVRYSQFPGVVFI
ncbi:hypothetical protein N7540_000035 [Penicillium herquei]|nr:hypothetical protein N7540_000035 [Penicillium herquei]